MSRESMICGFTLIFIFLMIIVQLVFMSKTGSEEATKVSLDSPAEIEYAVAFSKF